MDADRIAAAILIAVAIVWLVVACVIVGGRPNRPTPPQSSGESSDFDSEAARRYHGSDQWGR